MNVAGEYLIAAPRDRVWTALRDPETLRACLPGCESLRVVSDGIYEGRVVASLGALSAAFSGRAALLREREPESWSMSAHVRSDTGAGWADGEAALTLGVRDHGTLVAYRAEMRPGGRLAAMGSPLLHQTALALANGFFARLNERLRGERGGAEPLDAAAPGGAPPRRLVEPLAPTPPPPPPPGAPSPAPGAPADDHDPRIRRIIIVAGWIYFVTLLIGLFWPQA
ncbi:CoxG family protein [Magnetospirillum sp. UT-4]|uniref:CoxG family protein n=1 Tax=Magnetospirillum sp. UT-4 TaxID=2681467 RepID=UPI001381E859|nr:carbon monoxide dehydrogenase subunit G [Magnetospirillum sp. UT-4]CAA7625388.1 hypothetical protein MTBUT4_690004 [Magnetospirillum sp. UT-4]